MKRLSLFVGLVVSALLLSVLLFSFGSSGRESSGLSAENRGQLLKEIGPASASLGEAWTALSSSKRLSRDEFVAVRFELLRANAALEKWEQLEEGELLLP